MRKKALIWVMALLSGVFVFALPDWLGTGFTGAATNQLNADTSLGSLLFAYFGGVLTSLTPCVYPLIPITLSIFGARKGTSRGKGLMLVTAYVFGIAIMFSTLGYLAASSGQAFGTFLSNRFALIGLSVFFLLMAFSMFGAFEIRLPNSLAARLNTVGGKGGLGAFVMGLVAGLIAAPCTGPVLASLLTFVASSGRPLFGFSLLFSYAFGIGLPFFLLGAFSISLPKSGAWMESVKSIFGLSLLALAFSYFHTAYPFAKSAAAFVPNLALVSSIIVAIGVLFGAIHLSFHGSNRTILLKTVGVLLVTTGLALRFLAPHGGTASDSSLVFRTDYTHALADARKANKPVMIDFFADWCAACKELDKFTYTNPDVIAEASRFINIKIDGTIENDEISALYKQYKVNGLPTVVFLDSKGNVLEQPRITGFVGGKDFADILKKVE